MRRVDELGDLGALALDPVDDVADRLVDEGNPDLFRVGHAPKDGSLRPRPPAELGGDEQDQGSEEAPQDVFGQRQCGQGAPLNAEDGDDPDHDRGAPADVAVLALAPRAGDGVGMIAASEVASAST